MSFETLALLTPALLCLTAALIVAQQAWASGRSSRSARSWAAVEGQIVSAGVRERSVTLRRSTGINQTRQATRYQPQATYTYTVDGVTYTGARLALGPQLLSSDRASAERAAARLQPGQSVTVYVNPLDSSDATLDRRLAPGTWLQWLTSLGLALIALVLLLMLPS